MDKLNLESDWGHICQFFPNNLDEMAKKTGAVDRWRKIKNGEELMRLNLTYVVEDLSLRSTAAWSTRSNMADLKDTSVLHRLQRCGPFLEAVLAHLLNFRIGGEEAKGPVFRLNDATVISIPGSKGTDWHIHAIYDPASCRLIKVQVTDASGGERLDRHEYGHNEVVVGDRGLARARGIHSVAEDSAYCLLRMHWQNIRILDSSFKKPNLDEVLQRAKEGDRGTDIYVPLKGKPPIPARLIVQPLPKDQAEKARKKLRRNAAKKSRIPGKQALLLAGYFCVITTLPKEIVSDEVIMELYRIRWQIELFFKRCKSLLRIDELRADDPLLVKTYCTCKLIEAALVELLASEGETFSPWGVPRKRISACQ